MQYLLQILISILHSRVHYTPRAREVCVKPQMSYILTYVRVALATSEVQSNLEIPATDEIHMKDRNQTCVPTQAVLDTVHVTVFGQSNVVSAGAMADTFFVMS